MDWLCSVCPESKMQCPPRGTKEVLPFAPQKHTLTNSPLFACATRVAPCCCCCNPILGSHPGPDQHFGRRIAWLAGLQARAGQAGQLPKGEMGSAKTTFASHCTKRKAQGGTSQMWSRCTTHH